MVQANSDVQQIQERIETRELKLKRSWQGEREIHMSHFGNAYTGYFVDIDGCRQVGFINIVEEFRGVGYFHRLLEMLKDGVHTVVLFSPGEVTREVSERHGYQHEYYNDDKGEIEIMVWRR